MPIYELHEVTSIGDSANIDLNSPKSATVTEYSKTDQGTFILDKNMDLSKSRKIFKLNVTKLNQEKFNQVIDIEFEEFTSNVNDPNKFLENKLQKLEEARAKLLAESDIDKDLINRLQAEIDRLQPVNKVSDTLTSRQVLYADRDASTPDTPGYPNIENKLLSKNRKAIGIIQPDGNFVIYLGNFDESGNEIRNPDEPSQLTAIAAFGYNTSNGTPGLKIQISGGQGNVIVFRLGNQALGTVTQTYWEAFKNSSIPLSYASKLVLDDDGILTLYDGTVEKWSTKNMDPPKDSVPAAPNKALKSVIKDALIPWFTSTNISSTDPRKNINFDLEDATQTLSDSIESLKATKRTELSNIQMSVKETLTEYIIQSRIDRAIIDISDKIKKFIG